MTETSGNGSFPRPPKRFPQKDLHGRVRTAMLNYQDLDRFKRFCVNVFGWDMFVLPQTAGGAETGSENPSLVLATGPAYETWEGIVPGHMTAMAHHDPSGEARPGLFMEMSMHRPISETVAIIEAHGGRVIGEAPSDERDDWNSTITVADPSGNTLTLWKCPTSRTWEEPESAYDDMDEDK